MGLRILFLDTKNNELPQQCLLGKYSPKSPAYLRAVSHELYVKRNGTVTRIWEMKRIIKGL